MQEGIDRWENEGGACVSGESDCNTAAEVQYAATCAVRDAAKLPATVWDLSQGEVVQLFENWRGVVQKHTSRRTIKISSKEWEAVSKDASRHKYVAVGLWDVDSPPSNAHRNWNFTSKHAVVPWVTVEQEKGGKKAGSKARALGVVSVVYSMACAGRNKPHALIRKLDAMGHLCTGENSWQCRRLDFGAHGDTNKPSLPTLGWMASEDVHMRMRSLFENGDDAKAVMSWHKDDLERKWTDVGSTPCTSENFLKRPRRQASLQTEVAAGFTDTKKPAADDSEQTDTDVEVTSSEKPQKKPKMLQKPKCTRVCTCKGKCKDTCKRRKKKCPGKCCGCKCTSYRREGCTEEKWKCTGKEKAKTPAKKSSSSKGKKRSRSGSRGKPKTSDNEIQGAPKSGAVTPVILSDQDVRDRFVALHNAQATAESQMRIRDLELKIKEEKLKVMLQQVKDTAAYVSGGNWG